MSRVSHRPPPLHPLKMSSPETPTVTPIGANGEPCIPVEGTYVTRDIRAPSRLGALSPIVDPPSPEPGHKPAGYEGFGWSPDMGRLARITSAGPAAPPSPAR